VSPNLGKERRARWLGIARERKRTDTSFPAYVSTATDAIVYINNAMK
jgi:hypothetical protein